MVDVLIWRVQRKLAAGNAEFAIDLVLDPEPTRDEIHEVLGRHGFQDLDRAYVNLTALSITGGLLPVSATLATETALSRPSAL